MSSLIKRRELLAAIVASGAIPLHSAPIRFDKRKLDRLFQKLHQDDNPDLKGVRIVSNGRLVAEAYFNGGAPDVLHDIRSAGKSITSLLAGIAVIKKLISSVDVPISSLLGAHGNTNFDRICFEHLLTMRSGLSADDEDPASPGNESKMDQAASWLDFALSVPVREAPGKRYQYCSLNAFLVGACIENASRQPLDEFARLHFFGPLGIDRFEWRRGPQNRVAGHGNLRITLASMSAIGQMCLANGRVGASQIVNDRWLRRSMESIVSISRTDPYADGYGYMWYTKTHDIAGKPVRVHFASGNGGNKIYLVPELETVVAVTSAAYGQGYGQRRSQEILKEVLNTTLI